MIFADVVPMRIEEVLPVVGEAPFARIEPPRDTMPVMRRAVSGMKRSRTPAWMGVIDALLALLDQRILEDLPGQILGLAADLFPKRLGKLGPCRWEQASCGESTRASRECSGRWTGP